MGNEIFERDIFVSPNAGGQRLSIAVSTALQAGLLAAFLIISLLGRQIVVPYSTVSSVPWLPPSQSSPPRSSHGHANASVITRASSFVFQPRYVPHVATHGADVPPPSMSLATTCAQNCPGTLWPTGGSSGSAVKHAPGPRPVISHLEEGQIQNRVQPTYPQLAKAARIEGDVVLSAVISGSGDIERLQVVSGPPLLQDAALQALRQWRFRPYILNGRPIEIEARITIRFRLQ